MEIIAYQKIWGSKKPCTNNVKASGYYPTPAPRSVIRDNNSNLLKLKTTN